MADIKFPSEVSNASLASLTDTTKFAAAVGSSMANVNLSDIVQYTKNSMIGNGIGLDYYINNCVTDPLNIANGNGWHGLWSDYSGAIKANFPTSETFIGLMELRCFNADWQLVKAINLFTGKAYYNICVSLSWRGWHETSI